MNISKVALIRRLLGLLLFCATLSANAQDVIEKIRKNQTITIAYRESSIPFSYLDANKKPIGFAIDLCTRIADSVRKELKLSGLSVQFTPVTSSTRIPTIAEGKADLECGSTTNNVKRREQVAFTIPHFIAGLRMLVKTNAGINNWVDLKNKKLVTTKGTTAVSLIEERSKVRSLDFTLTESKDHKESFSVLENGEVDAFPMDDVLLFGLRANAKSPSDFVVVGDALSTEPYAIMLSKNDKAFKRIVDLAMADLIYSGEFLKLYNKWFNAPIPPNGINLKMTMGHLLRGSLTFPTDKVADD